MQIIVIKQDKLYKYPFPSDNINKYWLDDIDELGDPRELIAIEKKNNAWLLVSNDNCVIEKDNRQYEDIPLLSSSVFASPPMSVKLSFMIKSAFSLYSSSEFLIENLS